LIGGQNVPLIALTARSPQAQLQIVDPAGAVIDAIAPPSVVEHCQ
jgi:hypothetical protein